MSTQAECAEHGFRSVWVPMDVIAHKYPHYQGLCHYNEGLIRWECWEIVDCDPEVMR